MFKSGILLILISFTTGILFFACSNDDNPGESPPETVQPVCTKTTQTRVDAHSPETMVAGWSAPIRLGDTINDLCPQDAIEISRDGQYLYIMYTEARLEDMTPEQILARYNNTYRAHRIGGPGDFDYPVFYDLGKGIAQSLDGELSFTPDGSKVYFHSNRATNIGYNELPATDDYLDIYVAEIVNGEPGPGVNLGPEVNSEYPDGEHAIHPDGVTLYFASKRPGLGGSDIWKTTNTAGSWSTPVNLGTPINSLFNDLQPCFTQDGDTMYFTSDRNPLIGVAIYRSFLVGSDWSAPEVVIRGIVGEPSITADGQYLYFVHVLSDVSGTFDADVWFCERQ